jgi:hypothetical protein
MRKGKSFLRWLERSRMVHFRRPLRRLWARNRFFTPPPVYQHKARDARRLRPMHRVEPRE